MVPLGAAKKLAVRGAVLLAYQGIIAQPPPRRRSRSPPQLALTRARQTIDGRRNGDTQLNAKLLLTQGESGEGANAQVKARTSLWTA